MWDAQTGQSVIDPLKGHSDYVVSVAFSSDGRHIVSGSWDKTVRVWDAQRGQKILHSSSVSCLSNSSISNTYVVLPVLDGNNIDVCDSDKTIPCHSSNASLLNFCHLVGNWIMLSNNTYLIWLPNHNRSGLLWPRTTTVIGCTPTLLDFKDFVHGMNWSHCFSSLDDPI